MRLTPEQTTRQAAATNPDPKSALIEAKTQRAAILRVLVDAQGAWVPLPEIMKCAAQYNSRVYELRRAGFCIENKGETVNGQRRTWFRLLRRPEAKNQQPDPKTKIEDNKPSSDYASTTAKALRDSAAPLFRNTEFKP